MYNECRHILPGGHKCKAPALRGKVFCYHHTLARRPATNRVPETGPVRLASAEDSAGLIIAVNQVLREFGEGHIDRHSAGTFFYGLQVAASVLRKGSPNLDRGDVVREFCEDPTEGIIALEKTACDPEDCPTCEKRYECEDTQWKEDYRALIAELRKKDQDDD